MGGRRCAALADGRITAILGSLPFLVFPLLYTAFPWVPNALADGRNLPHTITAFLGAATAFPCVPAALPPPFLAVWHYSASAALPAKTPPRPSIAGLHSGRVRSDGRGLRRRRAAPPPVLRRRRPGLAPGISCGRRLAVGELTVARAG